MRRFTRLTNAFSKKFENHCHVISLHTFHCNFIRVHQTIRCTSAAAGIVNELWSIADLVKYADEFETTKGWELAQAS